MKKLFTNLNFYTCCVKCKLSARWWSNREPSYASISWLPYRQHICCTYTLTSCVSFGGPLIKTTHRSSKVWGSIPLWGEEIVFVSFNGLDERSSIISNIFDLPHTSLSLNIIISISWLAHRQHIFPTCSLAYHLSFNDSSLVKVSHQSSGARGSQPFLGHRNRFTEGMSFMYVLVSFVLDVF